MPGTTPNKHFFWKQTNALLLSGVCLHAALFIPATADTPSNKTLQETKAVQTTLQLAANTQPTALLAGPIELKLAQEITFDLDSIVSLFCERSLDVAIAETHIDQAKSTMYRAIAPLLPSVGASQSIERFKGGEVIFQQTPVSLDRTTYRPTLYADYQIHTGGKPFFDIWVSRSRIIQSERAFDQVQQASLLSVLEYYFTWLADLHQIELAQQIVVEAEAQLNINDIREQNGFDTKLDVMQAKTLYLEKKTDLMRAMNKANASQMALLSLLNLPLTQTPAAPVLSDEQMTWLNAGNIGMLLQEESDPTEKLYAMAEKNRPEIQQLQAEISQGKGQLASIVADMFPTISLSGYTRGIGRDMNSLRRTTRGMASIDLNFLQNLGFESIAKIKEARARIQEATLKKTQRLSEIQLDISQKFQDYQLQLSQLPVDREKIETATETYRIATARHQNGMGITLDSVQALTKLQEARQDYYTTLKNLHLSQLKLLFALGLLTPKVVLSHESDTVSLQVPEQGIHQEPIREAPGNALPATEQEPLKQSVEKMSEPKTKQEPTELKLFDDKVLS